MKLNQTVRVRYQVRFESKWISYSAFFAGLMFFLLCVVYFGLKKLSETGTGEMITALIFPLLLLTAFAALLRGIKCKVTPIYGIVGALFCVYMIIRAFSGAPGSAAAALIWYLLTAVITVATTFGIFPGRTWMVLAYLLPAVYRLVFVDVDLYFRTRDFLGFLPEAAALSGLLAFSFFGLCLKAVPVQKPENE